MLSNHLEPDETQDWVSFARIISIKELSFARLSDLQTDIWNEYKWLRWRAWLFDYPFANYDLKHRQGKAAYALLFRVGDREDVLFVLCDKDEQKDSRINNYQIGDLLHVFYMQYFVEAAKTVQPAFFYNYDTNQLIECYDVTRFAGMLERGFFPRHKRNKLMEKAANSLAREREGMTRFHEKREKPRIKRKTPGPEFEKFNAAELRAGVWQSLWTGLSLLGKFVLLLFALYLYSLFWRWREAYFYGR